MAKGEILYKLLKRKIFALKPRIYSLPEVYFIRWLDYEIFIHKWGVNHRNRWQ